MRMRSSLLALMVVAAAAWSLASAAQAPSSDGPNFEGNGQLTLPADYREWIYLTSGLGMTYGPAQPASNQPPLFDNVFVNPRSYREFMRTGAWPDKTMFVLEIRRAEANVSINNGGRTQGEVAFIEAAVKDTGRFASGGWGYFSFDSPKGVAPSAPPLPQTASCYACHSANTAVEHTFVQFYPTLFDVAKRMGTVKPTYDPNKKP
jgi:hypothetical protein